MSDDPNGSVIGGEQVAIPDNWKEALPEDIRNDPSLADVTDVTGLAKTHIHAQKRLGSTRLPLPADDAGPEIWKEFHRSLGVPDAPDQYNLTAPEGLPEGLEVTEDELRVWSERFHELGLRPNQVKALWTAVHEDAAARLGSISQATATERENWTTQMKQEFGTAYDQNVELAQRAFRHVGDDSLKQLLEETGYGNHPGFVRAFAKIGRMFSEGAGDFKAPGRESMGRTPDQAKAEIAAKQNDPNWSAAWTNRDHATHDQAVKEMSALMKEAYPEIPTT